LHPRRIPLVRAKPSTDGRSVQALKPNSEVFPKEGIAAVRKGDLQAAERLLKNALKEKPESAFANYWLGVAYMKEHRQSDA